MVLISPLGEGGRNWAIPFNIHNPPIEVLYIFSPPQKVNFWPPRKKRSKCQHTPPPPPLRIYSKIKGADTVTPSETAFKDPRSPSDGGVLDKKWNGPSGNLLRLPLNHLVSIMFKSEPGRFEKNLSFICQCPIFNSQHLAIHFCSVKTFMPSERPYSRLNTRVLIQVRIKSKCSHFWVSQYSTLYLFIYLFIY